MTGDATILWRRLDTPGHETALLALGDVEPRLEGVAVFSHEGSPCQLSYVIACDAMWQTSRVNVMGHIGGDRHTLALLRSTSGAWHVDGVARADLDGCIDVDLGFSPSTNLLPVRRLNLSVGASADVRAAWVRFPELTVEVLEQRYTRLTHNQYRYESAGGVFQRDIAFDHSGFVLSYPDYWEAER